MEKTITMVKKRERILFPVLLVFTVMKFPPVSFPWNVCLFGHLLQAFRFLFSGQLANVFVFDMLTEVQTKNNVKGIVF